MTKKSSSSSSSTNTTQQFDERVAATDDAVVIQLRDGADFSIDLTEVSSDPEAIEAAVEPIERAFLKSLQEISGSAAAGIGAAEGANEEVRKLSEFAIGAVERSTREGSKLVGELFDGAGELVGNTIIEALGFTAEQLDAERGLTRDALEIVSSRTQSEAADTLEKLIKAGTVVVGIAAAGWAVGQMGK